MAAGRIILKAGLLLALAFGPAGAEGKGEQQAWKELVKEAGLELVQPPKEAKGFSLKELDGGGLELEALRGKLVLLHFWATWSKAAPYELSRLHKLSNLLKAKPFLVVAVATDTKAKEAVEAFLKENPIGLRVFLDPGGLAASRFGVRVVPTSFLIDAEGRIRARAEGARPWQRPSVVEALRKVLNSAVQYGIMAGGRLEK